VNLISFEFQVKIHDSLPQESFAWASKPADLLTNMLAFTSGIMTLVLAIKDALEREEANSTMAKLKFLRRKFKKPT